MTIDNIDLDKEVDLEDTEIGRRFLFWNENYPDDKVFSFSSTLENIGIKHDCDLKNKTEVMALSDPTEAYHPAMGPILVTKILAHKIMWVVTNSLRWISND
jgi:hypothetical protein